MLVESHSKVMRYGECWLVLGQSHLDRLKFLACIFSVQWLRLNNQHFNLNCKIPQGRINNKQSSFNNSTDSYLLNCGQRLIYPLICMFCFVSSWQDVWLCCQRCWGKHGKYVSRLCRVWPRPTLQQSHWGYSGCHQETIDLQKLMHHGLVRGALILLALYFKVLTSLLWCSLLLVPMAPC